MTFPRWQAGLPLLCFWLPLAAVSAPLAMKLSPELEGVAAQPVRGRHADLWRSQLEFANWRVTAPRPLDVGAWSWEGWLAESTQDENVRVDVGRIAFEFGLGAAANRCLARGRFAVHTEYRGRVTDETSVALPGFPRVDCRFEGETPGQLSLRPDFVTQRESGEARFGERLWRVRSVNNLATQRSSFPLGRFGYEIASGERAAAAVEVVNEGRVWLRPDLGAAEREEVATVIASLLYYSQLRDAEDE